MNKKYNIEVLVRVLRDMFEMCFLCLEMRLYEVGKFFFIVFGLNCLWDIKLKKLVIYYC